MKRFQCFQYAAAAIASLGLVLPSPTLAADGSRPPKASTAAKASTAETPSILDVSLGEGGTLVGQVLNSHGAALADTAVTVHGAGADVIRAVTDEHGSFSVRGLQGGVYEVNAAGGSGVFRLWRANASPPSAHTGVLIVAGERISRGQSGPGQCCTDPCCKPCCKPNLPWYDPGRITNGHALVGILVILGAAGGIVAASITTQSQASAS